MKALRILALLMMAGSGAANAEGGCPSGYYPYDTPQARQCVPIPGGSAPSQPAGRWEDRWWAIAADPDTGEIGAAVGEPSKRAARKLAMDRCAESGGKRCKVEGSSYNQCVAITKGGGSWTAAAAASEKEAQLRAMEKLAVCKTDGSNCRVAWSDCSLPVRVR